METKVRIKTTYPDNLSDISCILHYITNLLQFRFGRDEIRINEFQIFRLGCPKGQSIQEAKLRRKCD